MDSLSAFDDLYTAIEACLIYPDEVIDRLARAFYPAILACWNSEEGSSRWGTPCCTYHSCLWLLAGYVRVGAPCFFVFNKQDGANRPVRS